MRAITVKRRYCPDCKCWVQAEFHEAVKADDNKEYDEWICLECGCCIEWEEV